MVEPQPSKLVMPVRSRSPAPPTRPQVNHGRGFPLVPWRHRLKGGRRWQSHGGGSIRISRRARSGLSGRPGSRSRRWPGTWALTRRSWGNWVNLDRRRRGEGNGVLGEDERAELARLRRENAQLAMERDELKRSVALWAPARWAGEPGGRDRGRGNSTASRRLSAAGRWASARRGSISGAAVMSRRGGPAGRPGKGRWRCDTRVAGPKQVVQRRAGRHDAGTIHGPTSVTRCPSTVSL
jgi:transposase